MAGSNTREVQLVILTDRVVAPVANQCREWALHDELYSMSFPVGYAGGVKQVVVVANRVEHLDPLVSVGVALSNRCAVEESDWDVGADLYRFKRASRTSQLINQAMAKLDEARLAETLDPLVYEKLRAMLQNTNSDRVQFSKDWEYASPLYCPMAVEGWSRYENMMVSSMLGTERSDDSVRQDRRRAREYMQAVHGGRNHVLLNAPSANRVELTEKYLTVVMPLILPMLRIDEAVSLGKMIVVTPRGGRVTSVPKKFRHEKKCRSAGAPPLIALPTGFFTGT
jgi:hypothetical protein